MELLTCFNVSIYMYMFVYIHVHVIECVHANVKFMFVYALSLCSYCAFNYVSKNTCLFYFNVSMYI